MNKPTHHSAWWFQLRRHWRSVVIVCVHALVLALMSRCMVGLTVDLMGNLIGDMGGSEVTDPSGKKYLGFIYIFFWIFAIVMTWWLLVPSVLMWAGFFEFLRTRSARWHCGVVAFIGWLLSMGLVYGGLTYFAIQDIGIYVAGGWEGTHSAVYAALMRPILQGLVDGIGPTYVLGYSLQWSTGLTALLALPWWWLHRRRAASPTERIELE